MWLNTIKARWTDFRKHKTGYALGCHWICQQEYEPSHLWPVIENVWLWHWFCPIICCSSFDTLGHLKKWPRPILRGNSLRYTVWMKHMCWLSELRTKAHNIGKSWKICVCPLYQGSCLRIRVVIAGSCLIGGDHGIPDGHWKVKTCRYQLYQNHGTWKCTKVVQRKAQLSIW